jgi:predicted ArsR family transcriptional regulator
VSNRADLALAALRSGPKTNADLREAIGVSGAVVARLMVKLRHRGLVECRFVKGQSAIYRLRETS